MRLQVYIVLISLLALIACDPQVVDKSELGPTPTASFEIVQDSTPNDFILRNTTEGAFFTQWDLGDFGKFEGLEVSVNMPKKGDYDITMTTLARGGHAKSTQSVTVTQDDPSGCFGNLSLLTGCTSKTWKLAPEEAAMHIGPNLNETWWGNSTADVTTRECHFNDEYTFFADGTFTYDNKGDFWADVDGNGNVTPGDLGLAEGCNNASDWPTKYKAWDSGTHSFAVTNQTLTVIGEGAWVGLYKVGTEGEVDTPQSSVSFSILSLTADRMVIYADYGWGIWRLTLTSN